MIISYCPSDELAGWDELAGGGDLFVSRRWLDLRLSMVDQARVGFLVAREADGTLAGGLPVLRVAQADPEPDLLRTGTMLSLAGQAADSARFDALTMPSLLCGGRQIGASRLLRQDPTVIAPLVSAALAQAGQLGLRSIAFLHVDGEDVDLRQALRAAGFVEFGSDTTYRLDLNEGGFDAYLARLSTSRRYQVRRDLRLLTEAGVRVRTLPLGEAPIDELAPLVAEREAKYGVESSARACEAELRVLAERFGSRAVVHAAWLDGALAGFSVFVEWKGHLYNRVLGFDYAVQRELPVYFSTNFYQPIAFAPHFGATKVHYGQLSGEAKIRRGCEAVPLFGYVRCLDPADQAVLAELSAAIPTR